MSAEEESAYIRLICYCWLQGSIPSDDEYLAKLIKGGSTAVVRAVKRCFHAHPDDETLLVHPRLERERDKQREWSRKSAAGGQESQKVQRDRRKVKGGSKGGSTIHARVIPECLQPNSKTSSSSSSSSSENKNKNPISDSHSSSDADGTPSSPEEFIYSEYPRKEGRRAAIKQIELAVVRMQRGESPLEPLSKGDAQKLLFKRVRAYAQSPAGQNPDKSKIPHPKTWFGQSRYLDDAANWQIISNKVTGESNGNRNAAGYESRAEIRRNNRHSAIESVFGPLIVEASSFADAANGRLLPESGFDGGHGTNLDSVMAHDGEEVRTIDISICSNANVGTACVLSAAGGD